MNPPIFTSLWFYLKFFFSPSFNFLPPFFHFRHFQTLNIFFWGHRVLSAFPDRVKQKQARFRKPSRFTVLQETAFVSSRNLQPLIPDGTLILFDVISLLHISKAFKNANDENTQNHRKSHCVVLSNQSTVQQLGENVTWSPGFTPLGWDSGFPWTFFHWRNRLVQNYFWYDVSPSQRSLFLWWFRNFGVGFVVSPY